MSIAYIANLLFHFYSLLIFIRILLTWIPNIDWNQQPIKAIREVSDVYLNIFRNVIPPLGMIDISPMIALIVLWIIQGAVVRLLIMAGL